MERRSRGFHPQIGESWSKAGSADVRHSGRIGVSIPRLGRVDRKKNFAKYFSHTSEFPSPDWGELIERFFPENFPRLLLRFHPQIGESWSKDPKKKIFLDIGVIEFPSPDWGELIERFTMIEKILLWLKGFHPQIGESWSKGFVFVGGYRFSIPPSFHPQIGESWSKEFLVLRIWLPYKNVSIPRLGRVDRKFYYFYLRSIICILVSIPRLGRVDRKIDLIF